MTIEDRRPLPPSNKKQTNRQKTYKNLRDKVWPQTFCNCAIWQTCHILNKNTRKDI